MKNIKHILLIICWTVFSISTSTAQPYESKNGYKIPTEGSAMILIVFAEMVGSCAGDDPSPDWPSGTALPPNADLYIDHAISSNPNTALSQYYKDVSLGELNVIGDYYGETVQVPCGGSVITATIQALNSQWQPAADGKYYTHNGLSLDEFDQFSYTGSGVYKPNTPDGKIDAFVILFRNAYGCNQGLGVGNTTNQALANKTVGNYGAWAFCPEKLDDGGYDSFFVAEYFHSLFGGNNFHTGGGASSGSFMFNSVRSFGTTAQWASTSNTACGWDRQFLDWRGNRQFPVSASNQTGQEVVSNISVATHPNTSYFVLNDFVTVGDAIRIKLPHFDWQTSGDKKNQYLWVENHQMVSEFDLNKGAVVGCESWLPGMHAYIQVGKDILSGSSSSQIYGGSYAMPNSLKDWLFPLPAEGRYDFYNSYSDANTPHWSVNCNWGNESIPYSIQYPDGSVLENPFTGFSDLYGYIDSNMDGYIYAHSSNDVYQARWQKWSGIPTLGSPPASTIPAWGDGFDAFISTGQKLSITTNPAPMPVYTQREGTSAPSNYDNRSIHLNNISVKIVDDNYYNVSGSTPKSFLIEVKFDEALIENDVRWCGNIVLKNDPADPLNRPMEINVAPNKCILIDKGISPTKLQEVTPGSGDFTDDSYLHLLDGTITTLQSGACINITNGSTFHVQDGATLIIGPNALVEVDASSTICIEDGAKIFFEDVSTSQIIVAGQAYPLSRNLVDITLSSAPSDYYAFNQITTSGTNPGVTMPSSGDVVLEAGRSIILSENTLIVPNSTDQSFLAHINMPYDCSDVNNYNLMFLADTDTPDEESNAHTHGDHSDGAAQNIVAFDGLTLFPNPAQDVVRIQYKEVIRKPVEVFVYNAVGQLVLSKRFDTDMGGMSIPTKEWSPGVYLFHITRDNKRETQKLIVK